jgi:signal transduction histidine kinase
MCSGTVRGTLRSVVADLDRLRSRVIAGVPISDAVLAALIALFTVLDVWFSGDWRGPVSVNVAVVLAGSIALAWRRRAPLAVLGVVVTGLVVLSLTFGASQTWSSGVLLAVAVYSAMAHGPSPLAAAALAVTAAAVHTSTDPLVRSFGDALWSSAFAGLAVLAGVAGRVIGRQRAALDHRAAALDRVEAERIATAVADERAHIARELHDIVAHSLGLVVLQAGAAAQVLGRDPDRARAVLDSIRETGQQAIGEMGTMLGLLRTGPDPSRAPLPSLEDLPALVASVQQTGLTVTLQVDDDGGRTVSPAVQLSAYRAVQEGLTNVLKHAGATRACVTVRASARCLAVEVTDDGAVRGRGTGSRRGLVGLGERVAVFGGQLEAGPRPKGGWSLHATFPLDR